MNAYMTRYLWGRSEFKSRINCITVDVCQDVCSEIVHPPPILPPLTFALTISIRRQPHAITQKWAPPLPWGMWAQIQMPQHTWKAVPAASAPPLSRGMWVAHFCLVGELGRDSEGEPQGGTQELGSTMVRNENGPQHLSWPAFSHFSLLDPTNGLKWPK